MTIRSSSTDNSECPYYEAELKKKNFKDKDLSDLKIKDVWVMEWMQDHLSNRVGYDDNNEPIACAY